MIKRMRWLIVLVILFMFSFAYAGTLDGGVTPEPKSGATIADPGTNLSGYAQQWYDAVRHHSQWALVAALALVGVCYLLRQYGGKFLPGLRTDRGGAALALLSGIGGAVANGLAAGKAVNMDLMWTGLQVGFTAAGGWSVLRRLMGWSDAQVDPPSKPGSDGP